MRPNASCGRRFALRARLGVVASTLMLGAPVQAQGLVRAGITRSNDAVRLDAALPVAPVIVAPSRPASPWPYVLVGAFVGGVATVAAISWSTEQSGKDCICSPIMFAPVVLGGAALGGAGGYIVYRIRM